MWVYSLIYVTGEWWFKVVCFWDWDWRDATSRCSWCRPTSTLFLHMKHVDPCLIIAISFPFFLVGWFWSTLYLLDIVNPTFSTWFPIYSFHWLKWWSLQLKDLILLVLEKQRLSHGEMHLEHLADYWYSDNYIYLCKMLTLFSK